MLTLGTGARNIPAALLVANLNFGDADVLVMCVLFAVVSLVACSSPRVTSGADAGSGPRLIHPQVKQRSRN